MWRWIAITFYILVSGMTKLVVGIFLTRVCTRQRWHNIVGFSLRHAVYFERSLFLTQCKRHYGSSWVSLASTASSTPFSISILAIQLSTNGCAMASNLQTRLTATTNCWVPYRRISRRSSTCWWTGSSPLSQQQSCGTSRWRESSRLQLTSSWQLDQCTYTAFRLV